MATSPSGKRYIGQTIKPFKKRMQGHVQAALRKDKKSSSSFFARAIRKYGPERIEWEILADGIPEHLLDECEIKSISSFKTMKPLGYNLCPGGPTPKGAKRTFAQIEKNRENAKAMWGDPGYRSKMLKAFKRADKGWYTSEEFRSLKRAQTKSWRDGMSESEKREWYEKNLAARKSWDQEKRIATGRKISISKKKNRAKISETSRNKWKDPEYRNKVLSTRSRNKLAKEQS